MDISLPAKEPISIASMLLSALIHLLLVGALFLGVQWKNQTPFPVAVELWQAAPGVGKSALLPESLPEPQPKPRVEPPPRAEPTMDPDILIKEQDKKRLEKERQEKKRQEQLEKERQTRAKQDELRKQADRDLRDAQRRREMQAMMAGADAELNQRQAAQATADRVRGQRDYSDRISAKIRGNIVLPPSINGNPEAVFKIRQLPSGEIIDVKLSKSTGNKLLDEAIERAIRKSNPLPLPGRADIFDRDIDVKYKPFDE